MFQENRLIKRLETREELEEILDEAGLQRLIDTPGKGSCGVAAIQSATGATREVVELLLDAVCQNDIRAGRILDSKGWPVGDGAGIALRTDPDDAGKGMQQYLGSRAGNPAYDPKTSTLNGGLFFLDQKLDEAAIRRSEQVINEVLVKYGFTPLDFSKAVTDPTAISDRSKRIMPQIYQLIYGEENHRRDNSEKALFAARVEIQKRLPGVDIVSLQPGTITFKGMLRGAELRKFYPDLDRPDIISDAGLVHTRFGTNTLAKWSIAQPFGVIAHNGEVNSIRKILKVMENLERMNAIPGTNIMPNASDSANLDRALQFLQAKGLSLEESVRWMIHPPLDDLVKMPEAIRNYFAGVSRAMGSLKAIGPIALLGMDRNKIVAALDNMGLRPLRVVQRKDKLVIIASEVGMPHVDNRTKFDRIGPGEMRILERSGKQLDNQASNQSVVDQTQLNYQELATERIEELATDLLDPELVSRVQEGMEKQSPKERVIYRANLFGANSSRLKRLQDSINAAKDPVEGMGSDLALACFSPEPNNFGRYTSAHWSQVSNPSLDYIRESGAFSTKVLLGARPHETEEAFKYNIDKQYALADPLLDDDQMTALYARDKRHKPKRITIQSTFEGNESTSCEARIEEIKDQVLESARSRQHAIIVLSDRKAELEGKLYIPPHILVAYISRELDKEGLSSGVSLIVDTGEVFDQHEFNLLVACGAKAVHPRSIYELIDSESLRLKTADAAEAKANLRKSFQSTLLRYMAKIGMTDIDAYRGSQEFSTIGLSKEMIEKYFRSDDVDTNGGGVGLETLIAAQIKRRQFDSGGRKVRKSEEREGYKKSIMSALQAVGANIAESAESLVQIQSRSGRTAEELHTDMEEIIATEQGIYDDFVSAIKEEGVISYRDIYKLKESDQAIPLAEVMPRDEIIKQVIRGAGISLGSINDTAHRALHMLFNFYGSRANSGEGGVPIDRRQGEKWEMAAARSVQTASGRFANDVEYLANPQVEEIEIKIGQGAKPGVGGHLPGRKTFPMIADIRGVALGQELISPPTNHDIYSIEDLEALIQRLSTINPAAKIAVKITSGNNVGTIAAGCVKAGADKVQLSGAAGGTGAATQTDKYNTGLPTEFAVAYANRSLIEQGIRHKAELGADGGIRTGEDVLKLLALGANNVSLGTMLLISQLKCIFCQQCSTQKCPAYITRSTTKFLGSSRDGRQKIEYSDSEEDQQLARLLYNGMRTLEMLAEDIRKQMAKMGVRTLDELIGKQSEFLEVNPQVVKDNPWIEEDFDHSIFLEEPSEIFKRSADHPSPEFQSEYGTDPSLEAIAESYKSGESDPYKPDNIAYYLDSPKVNPANREIILQALRGVSEGQNPINIELTNIRPKDRNLGATLGGLIVKGLIKAPSKGIIIRTIGDAGLGYGAGTTHSITMIHTGPIQNECASFQNAGRIVIQSPINGSNDQYIVGNTLAYGSRGGERFVQGSVGDRCCVRETAGLSVITGNTGKYFAGYKTGGRDIVLGELGNAVGAGMSGGEIYCRDPEIASKLEEGTIISKVLREKDLEQIYRDLLSFWESTHDPEVDQILQNWQKEKLKFKKVIAESSYGTRTTEFLFAAAINNQELTQEQQEELLGQLFEMCGHDIDSPSCPLAREQVLHLLNLGLTELKTNILPNIRPRGSEEAQFMATQEFSFKLAKAIRNYLNSSPEQFLSAISEASN